MALKTWIGGAAAGSQIDEVTVGGTIATNDVFNILIATDVIATYTAVGGDGADEVSQGLVSAWNASGNPLGSPITAADISAASVGTLTLTADTAGVPFTATVTKTSSGGTIAISTTAENYGPNDWNTLANWDSLTLPVVNDDVLIQGSSSILYGLDQSSVTLNDLTVRNYSGNIGSPGDPLQVDLGTSDKLMIDSTGTTYLSVTGSGAASIDCEVSNTGGGATAGLFLASPDLSTLTVNRGSVALGTDPGDTTTQVTELQINYITSQSGDAIVTVGPDVTLATLHMTGGSCTLQGAVTTIQNQGGAIRTEGSGAITTATIYSGSLVSNSTGTIGTLNLNGGNADFTQTRTSRTVTTLNMTGSSQLMLDTSVVTLTNDIAVSGLAQLTASEL
ncbi:MAG: hypothetical protein AAGI37_09895 [Planctomycetota bacterium]